jgi:hypothetical protein
MFMMNNQAISRKQRIPLAFQKVFLSATRGSNVTERPSIVGSLLRVPPPLRRTIRKQGSEKQETQGGFSVCSFHHCNVRSPNPFGTASAGHHIATGLFGLSVRNRGYVAKRINTLTTSFHKRPSKLQKESYQLT